jgi:hypothetical protein
MVITMDSDRTSVNAYREERAERDVDQEQGVDANLTGLRGEFFPDPGAAARWQHVSRVRRGRLPGQWEAARWA